MCYKIKCAIQYTVDLINNNINRDVQEECANGLDRVYTHSSNTYDGNSECFTVNNETCKCYETEFVFRSLMA